MYPRIAMNLGFLVGREAETAHAMNLDFSSKLSGQLRQTRMGITNGITVIDGQLGEKKSKRFSCAGKTNRSEMINTPGSLQ